MQYNVVFSSDSVRVIRRDNDFYIESSARGMSLENFNKLLGEHPEIKITSIMAIRNALVNAPRPPEKFGEAREHITVEISSDELKATMVLSANEEELTGGGKTNLIREIMKKLNEKGVVFGIKNSVLLNNLTNNKEILIAEGVPPENGKDSEIRMYEIREAKPEAREDGNVDHYELNLINRVKAGEWLGERLDPTEGTPGKTVKGSTVLPMKGKSYPLIYDRNTVREEYTDGVTTLYSMINGAVHYDGDRIGVSNHLEIASNVDFKTGNIDFDGYLTIKGSIEDSFSAVASKDMEILGDYGLGSVKDITSREGNIYIRGGIAGKNRAVIKCKKNIYTKFVSDTTIICDGSVHIGFYCINSNITAKEVVLDSPKGQIIGGNIKAEVRVVSALLGSPSEKRTCITVTGFDRNAMKKNFEELCYRIDGLKSQLVRAKQEVSVYSNTDGLSRAQMAEYERVRDAFFDLKDKIKKLEEERKAQAGYLRTHGEGEVSVTKRIYPNTVLQIKNLFREINREIPATGYYYQEGQLKEL